MPPRLPATLAAAALLGGCATRAPAPPALAARPATLVRVLTERRLAPPALAAEVWLALTGGTAMPAGAPGYELVVQTQDGRLVSCTARAGLGIGNPAARLGGTCRPAGS